MLERIRAIPPGFVRAYGDVSPGAPRFAGTVLYADTDPTLTVVRFDSGYEVWAYPEKRTPDTSEFVVLFAPSGIMAKSRVR